MGSSCKKNQSHSLRKELRQVVGVPLFDDFLNISFGGIARLYILGHVPYLTTIASYLVAV